MSVKDEQEDDVTALAGLSSFPPPQRKVQPNSQHLQINSSRPPPRRHNLRKESLDGLPKPLDPPASSNESSEDKLFPHSSPSTNAQSGEDYVGASCRRLDQSLSLDCAEDSRHFQPLPEFIGAGSAGVFKAPMRASVHPGRPPCLEIRPHPLRETQTTKFLRNIACTETQLWAGQDGGIRFWRFDDVFKPGLGAKVRRGDEDAAPFQESANTSPTLCLLVDGGNRLVWSGHKDGKIRSWKMDLPPNDFSPFKEGLSWQAHRGPVLSLIMSSYGDMWSGGEDGIIKIWPCESLEKSLSLRPEEKHMAALLLERSFIDLRNQVTVNGICSISSADIKHLISDNIRAKVWDARTKELLKVFNIEGQIENRVEMSGQDQPVEDEVKVKLASSSKKDKSGGFIQRSRNAIMGAADAVRRVATRGAGAFVEENTKRTEAIVLSSDGIIWTGYSNGLIVQWDGNGNRLQDFTYNSSAVQCFCAYGARIYVGYVSGLIQVMDLEGYLIAGWIAHNCPVVNLAAGNGYIYSLASHGGVRGWSFSSPGPMDSIIRADLEEKESTYSQQDSIRIVIGTWNVGQGRASQEALMSWLGSVVLDVGIVVVGLQEVEMGAGFLAMSAAKETVGLEGSSIGHWWLDTIGKALEENVTFERMGSRQLAGLLICMWVRKNLRMHVGDLDAAAVPCGFGRAIGNKGGVGLRIRVFDRTMCFVNCHLAAHLEAVNRRNADFDHIYRNLAFYRSSTQLNNPSGGASTPPQSNRNTNTAVSSNSEDTKPDLADADMVVFTGDFNYRLFGITYDEARDFVSQRCFDWLREKDQLRAEMKAGKVFQGMREAVVRFPPTYKFERHKPGLGGYDSGEKKRIPAWCDRVIFRDSRSGSLPDTGLGCPVVSSVVLYEACMDVTESDHKPVRCKFHCNISHVDRSIRRQAFGEIMESNEKIKSILDELRYVPVTVVTTNSIVLQNQDTEILQITNKSEKDKAVFKIICEGQCNVKDDEEQAEYQPRGCFGFPRWLEVTPAAGVIKPDHSMEVLVHHEEFQTLEDLVDGIPQNWWCEDTRDKEVILRVLVQGSCSIHTVCHKINVRHCFSAKTIRIGSKSNDNNKKGAGGSFQQQSTSSNTANYPSKK